MQCLLHANDMAGQKMADRMTNPNMGKKGDYKSAQILKIFYNIPYTIKDWLDRVKRMT